MAQGPVLVVDDEEAIRRALGTNLEARGYTVDLAGTGSRRSTSPPAATPTS